MNELSESDLRRNQFWLLLFFIYSTFSGALRKWVFMGSSGINNVILVVQLMIPFMFIFLLKRQKNISSYSPLVPYALLLVLFALNPMNMSIFHGIFGFIIHFGFWLMMFIYLNERDAFPIEKLILPFIIICIIQALLTFVQFNMPILHPINRYESGDSTSGFESGGVRVSGTFSYIGGYAAFIYFFGMFVWALMVENKRNVGLILFLAGFCVLGAFMNGSRTTTLAAAVFIGFGIMSYGTVSSKIRLLAIIPIFIIFASVYNLGDKFPSFENAYEAFMGRVEYGQRTGESNLRAYETVFETFNFESENTLFGLGLGATYQGATQTWGSSPYVKAYGFYEEEPERILLEGGYALMLLRIGLFILMIRQLKIPLLLSIPIMFYLFFFAQIVSSTFQCAFTFWGIVILDKMYYLKSLETSDETSDIEQESLVST